MSKLYNRDFYLKKDVEYLVSKRIVEYDIKSAGFNLIKYFDLLPKDRINQLERFSKSQRQIEIGWISKYDKEFAVQLQKSFALARKMFFEANELNDDDILSIKKDAIFVITKKLAKTKFENINFTEKNVYSSYHRFGNIEMYYNSMTNKLDIKGINNDSLYQHKNYFITFLCKVFRLIEYGDYDAIVSYIKEFVYKYKNRLLSKEFYRELNPENSYELLTDDNIIYTFRFGLDSISDEQINNLDISYNYITYILPLIQRFLYKNIRV